MNDQQALNMSKKIQSLILDNPPSNDDPIKFAEYADKFVSQANALAEYIDELIDEEKSR